MTTPFKDLVADLLDRLGAAVEPLEPDGLNILVPDSLAQALDWPEQVRLGFGFELPAGARRVAIEGDWIDRFAALLGDRGRWVEWQHPAAEIRPPGDLERLVERAFDLPNAIARSGRMTATWTRCLLLAFRYAALSDEKREGLLWLGVNLGTGAAFGDMLPRLRQLPEGDAPWSPPEPSVRAAAGPSWSKDKLEARIRPLLDHALSQDMQPFLRAMRRRLDRDCARVHAYHEELRRAALTKLAALGGGESDKAEAARRRESLRIEAIEREYRLKLDDLRNNYAVSVVVEWIQALDLYLPVHRIEIEIHRRKGRRAICLDWHPILRAPELPPTDWGAGLTRTRLVCDDRLHLTEPEGQAPCASCGKPWCRACHPSACPRCR